MTSHERKPVDFDFPNGQIQRLHGENRFPDQYYVVCVPQTTEDDVQLYQEAREKYGSMCHMVSHDLFDIINPKYVLLLFEFYHRTLHYSPIWTSYLYLYISKGCKWTTCSSSSWVPWNNGFWSDMVSVCWWWVKETAQGWVESHIHNASTYYYYNNYNSSTHYNARPHWGFDCKNHCRINSTHQVQRLKFAGRPMIKLQKVILT